MSYTVTNFKAKKALKEAVKLWCFETDNGTIQPTITAIAVTCFNPGLGPDLAGFTGKICLEGPHYPAAHTWYAESELKNGVVVKVK